MTPTGYSEDALFAQKKTAVFQHIYEAYYGARRSVYAAT